MICCVGSTGSKRSRVSVSSCFTFHSSAVSLLQKSREKESGMLEEAASDQTSEERKVERKVFVNSGLETLTLQKVVAGAELDWRTRGSQLTFCESKALQALTTPHKFRVLRPLAGRSGSKRKPCHTGWC